MDIPLLSSAWTRAKTQVTPRRYQILSSYTASVSGAAWLYLVVGDALVFFFSATRKKSGTLWTTEAGEGQAVKAEAAQEANRIAGVCLTPVGPKVESSCTSEFEGNDGRGQKCIVGGHASELFAHSKTNTSMQVVLLLGS